MTVPTDLDTRFRETAARAGLLDAAYDVIDSEIGPLLAAVTERGLARISFDAEPERELESIAQTPIAEFPRMPWASLDRGFIVRPLQEEITRAVKPALLEHVARRFGLAIEAAPPDLPVTEPAA